MAQGFQMSHGFQMSQSFQRYATLGLVLWGLLGSAVAQAPCMNVGSKYKGLKTEASTVTIPCSGASVTIGGVQVMTPEDRCPTHVQVTPGHAVPTLKPGWEIFEQEMRPVSLYQYTCKIDDRFGPIILSRRCVPSGNPVNAGFVVHYRERPCGVGSTEEDLQ